MVSKSDIRQSLLKMTASAVFSLGVSMNLSSSVHLLICNLSKSYGLRVYKPL